MDLRALEKIHSSSLILHAFVSRLCEFCSAAYRAGIATGADRRAAAAVASERREERRRQLAAERAAREEQRREAAGARAERAAKRARRD